MKPFSHKALYVSGLSISFKGKDILKDISFSLSQGDTLYLVGANGSGKTTLLRCIAGIEKGFKGFITVFGINVADYPKRRLASIVGYLPQRLPHAPLFTVREFLEISAYPSLCSPKDTSYILAESIE
ncbi:MAG: ABC transporter ATP-binding protein, partial [Candidatus Dadabacteria bacterium]